MNKRLVVVLAFALLTSAGASFLLYGLLSSGNRAKPKTVSMVVAAKPLRVGVTIREGDVQMVSWAGTVSPEAVRKIDDVVGRGVVSDILAGEPIVEPRLAAKGAGGGLAATIPPGMRAVAIRVNDVASVAGFVLPRTRVDVLMSASPPDGSSAGKVTKTILQNVEVLSAGKNIEKDGEGKPVSVPVINLLVTPEQAEVLGLATTEASLQLVLRNPIDTELAQTPGTALEKLFGGGPLKPEVVAPAEPRQRVARALPPPPAPPERPHVVEIIQGTKKTDTSFPTSGERP
jgi:pilus assembly protein CpaB